MQSQGLPSVKLHLELYGFRPLVFGVLVAGWLSQRTGGDDRRIIGGLYALAAVAAVAGAYIIKLQYTL